LKALSALPSDEDDATAIPDTREKSILLPEKSCRSGRFYLISSTYPAMMEFSGGLTYSIYGIMNLLSFLFVWRMVPETKGKTLEEMENRWKK